MLKARDKHKATQQRAVSFALLRSEGFTYREVGIIMGGVSVSRAHTLVKKGQAIIKRRLAREL